MELYEHSFFAGLALTCVLALTNWYKVARIVAIPIFTIDLIIHTFIQTDVVRVVIAVCGLASIAHELIAKKPAQLARKTKILGGIILLILGALTLVVLPYPYFLIAGTIITLFAYFEKKT